MHHVRLALGATLQYSTTVVLDLLRRLFALIHTRAREKSFIGNFIGTLMVMASHVHVATLFDYKYATHRIPTNELSPVRLLLPLVNSLIKLHIDTPESVGLFTVCSPEYTSTQSPDVYSLPVLMTDVRLMCSDCIYC